MWRVCSPFPFLIGLSPFPFLIGLSPFPFLIGLSPFPFPDEETDMDVHDRGMLYYRLLKHDVTEVGVMVWVTMVMDSPLVTALF